MVVEYLITIKTLTIEENEKGIDKNSKYTETLEFNFSVQIYLLVGVNSLPVSDQFHGSQSPMRLLKVSRCLIKSFIF